MTPDTVVDELERLRGLERDAAHRRDAARRDAREGVWETHRAVTAPLREYADDVAFNRREADPAEHRRLHDALIARIADEGLVFEEANAGLRLTDPAAHAAYDAAAAAHAEARRRRAEFERASADDLIAARKAAEMRRVRDALAGDDIDAARAALS